MPGPEPDGRTGLVGATMRSVFGEVAGRQALEMAERVRATGRAEQLRAAVTDRSLVPRPRTT